MNKKFPTHWLEEIVERISQRNISDITLATGKTPSGHIHIGILREILICDALRRILEEKSDKVSFLLFIDDLDAAKRFPEYIDKEFQIKYIGKPFVFIPCPFKECGCESYAYHFGNELISTFEDFGIKNKIIWTHKLYKTKEMHEKIKITLENTDKVKNILKKYIFPTLDNGRKREFVEMQKNWIPVMAICEKCNKIQFKSNDGSIIPNRVLKYNNKEQEVTYQCSACGYKGVVSIYDSKLKLNWRVDWPAKWAIYKTTCEPAGKDHCVKGGSYDTGLELCREIFKYEGPIKVAYEWLRLGDRDMKTSKGIIFIPQKYLEIADPELYRMLILRTNPMKHISFRIEEIPQYYDYFEKMENIYYNIEMGDSEKERIFLRYLYPLTKINDVPNKKACKIPLKHLIFLSQVQNILSIEKLYAKVKSVMEAQKFERMISIEDFGVLLQRTKNWVDEIKTIIENEKDKKIKKKLMQKVSLFEISDNFDKNILNKLDEQQINGIKILRHFLLKNENLDADLIQNKIFTIAKEDLNMAPTKLFEAIYQIILGKKFGPRLGSFLSLLDKNWLVERLNINLI